MNHRSLLTLLLAAYTGLCAADHAVSSAALSPDQALKELLAGNKRYCDKGMTHPHQSAARRTELAKAQHPFAIVLSCSDSRVPPEVVFDQGLGDLFVIRVAGNAPSDEVIASIEYAVAHLGSKLIVVLGHEKNATFIAGNFRNSQEALYAADAAVERVVQDLLLVPRWNDILSGASQSGFVDGAMTSVKTSTGRPTSARRSACIRMISAPSRADA